jgi:adenylate cyclase
VLEQYPDRTVIGAHFAEDVTRAFMPPSPTLIDSPRPESDPRVGVVNFWPDLDEVVRRARYAIPGSDYFGENDPELAGRVYTTLAGRILERVMPGVELPREPAVLRLAKPGQGIRRESFHTIFVEDDWRTKYAGGKFFGGKAVVIGPFGNRFKDELLTPLGQVHGAEMHLNAVNAILRGDSFVELGPGAEPAALAGMILVAFLLAIPAGSPLLRFGALLGAALAYFGAALAAANMGLLLPVLTPLVGLLAAGASAQAYQQLLDQVERARTRRTLERYVSRDVVKELLDEPASFLEALGGVRRPVTVMFSDLRGFTTMTEKGDSHQLVAQLNEYFTEMVGIVFAHGGTLDKFIGDAIMAVWGSIRSGGPEEDVARCTAAVLEMREALARLNETWAARGWQRLAVGFGVNHGEAIAGNIGSPQKMELTVIGDAVNLASRLEGVTKEYGLDLLLGEDAGKLAAGRFHVLEVDRVQVKGRSRPAEIYTVLGPKESPLGPGREEFPETYRRALERYRAADFAGAARLFARCRELDPASPLPGVYLARCEALGKEPPPPGWDGVFVMTKK